MDAFIAEKRILRGAVNKKVEASSGLEFPCSL